MLLRFSIENFLSFKEKVTLNLEAASIKEHKENVFSPHYYNGISTLKSAGIFGHNASGKSNLIRGLSFVKEFVSISHEVINFIPVEPFRLSTVTENKPATFEVSFIVDRKKFRYGFTVNSKSIEGEWLFITEKRKEENLFVRANQNFSFDKTFRTALKGKYELVYEMTRPNSLFLSVLAKNNFPIGLTIYNWFQKLFIANDIDHLALIQYTASLLDTSGDYRKLIIDVIKKSDLGIDSVEARIKEVSESTRFSKKFITELYSNNKEFVVKTAHIKFNEKDNPSEKILFDLLENESLGTQKFFGILGPLLFTLKEQGIIFIDEIDARMHGLLLQDVINLFNSNKTNPNGSQLIFTSHNTNILKKGLRRDQMIFVEKDSFGISKFDRLHDKDPKVRNDATFDKDYLSGKYGAIPGLGSQLDLFNL